MKIAVGLLLFPVWIVFMVCYPFVWLGARMWHLTTGDEGPLRGVENIGWVKR